MGCRLVEVFGPAESLYKKPTDYPDTPEGRREFNDYKREEAALNADKTHLLGTPGEIKRELGKCAVQMIAQWTRNNITVAGWVRTFNSGLGNRHALKCALARRRSC